MSNSMKGIKKNFSDNHIENLSNAIRKDYENNPERRNKISESNKGRIRINNGIINRYVKPDELDYYISIGFEIGLIKRK